MVEQIIAAGRGGADGVMVACSGDPGVAEGRTLLSGAGRRPDGGRAASGLRLRLQDRHRHRRRPVVVGILRDDGRYLRLADRGSPVSGASRFRRWKRSRSASHNPEIVAKAVAETASELVEDGADAIVIGSAGLSVMSSAAGPDANARRSSAPIFDCLTVGLKMTELRVDLTRQVRACQKPAASAGASACPKGRRPADRACSACRSPDAANRCETRMTTPARFAAERRRT